MENIYDVIVLGAGPAGLSAGLYAGRSRLSVLILEQGQDGGQIALTHEIENYPGQLLEGESGHSLTARMAAQAEKFGAVRVSDRITQAELTGEIKTFVGEKDSYRGRTVILACGAAPRPIGCANEAEYVGRGISFCATCDGAFFEDLEVFVAGGGDAAVEEAIFLTRFARKVTLIHRRDTLRAAKSIQEKAFAHPKIHFIWNSVVESVGGDEVLSRITLRNVQTGERTTLEADPNDGMFGLFGFLGYLPNTQLFAQQLPLEDGYLVTDEMMATSLAGVFGAGDIRRKSLRQVITAAADGAIAAVSAEQYLSR